jgi:type III secretion protein Q
VSRPMALTRFSTGEAQALSTLARHGQSVKLYGWAGEGELHLSLQLYNEPQGLLGEDAVRLDIEWAGASVKVDFAPSAIDYWLRMYLGTEGLPPEQDAWRKAALYQACQWLTDTLSASGRGQAYIRGTGTSHPWRPTSARHSLLMRLQHTDAQGKETQTLHGLLHLDALGLLLSAGLLPTDNEPVPVWEKTELPVLLYLGVGETDLSMTQLGQLKNGDVVFFSRSLMTRDQILTLRTESVHGPWWVIPGRLDETTVHILQSAHTMSSTDTSPDTELNDDTTPLDIHGIPIRISFDLGHTTLTLGEMQSLQPGEVLQLPRSANEYVTIRANGAAIGAGQLVDIDGRLGVSVSKLHAPVALTSELKG